MIYVDESIQHELGYICVGFAYCENSPDEAISSAIIDAGLAPGRDEYKSGARMVNADALRVLRERVAQIVLQQCKLGLYIAPVSERPFLLDAVVETAEQIVRRNQLAAPQTLFVDGGIHCRARKSEGANLNLVLECDSKSVLGIQLADYVAYHCSYLMKCAVTGTSKKVLVEMPFHPKTDEEVELDWIMRTELRRNFFVEYRDIDEITGDDWFFKLAGYGSYFSPGLDVNLLSAARETFDSMYFGCVW